MLFQPIVCYNRDKPILVYNKYGELMNKRSPFLVLTLLSILLLVFLIVFAGNTAIEISQAQAVIESARAAKSAAEAAKISAGGLAVVSTIQAVILAVIPIAAVVIMGMFIYLTMEKRRRDAQLASWLAVSQSRRWAPGPNAGFRKANSPTLPLSHTGDTLTQLIQLLLLQQVGQMPRSLPPSMPISSHAEADDELDLWG